MDYDYTEWSYTVEAKIKQVEKEVKGRDGDQCNNIW